MQNPKIRQRQLDGIHKYHVSHPHHNRQTPKSKKLIGVATKHRWQDPNYRKRHTASIRASRANRKIEKQGATNVI